MFVARSGPGARESAARDRREGDLTRFLHGLVAVPRRAAGSATSTFHHWMGHFECASLFSPCSSHVPPPPAGVGDPQIRTDHPWYPGELACSTFERLFATQAEVYKRVTGRDCTTDEDKALAAWLWRNTHYCHGEEGAEDLWGKGFSKGRDMRTREYWTGLFAHGFGLCGTTHSQWVAEMEALLRPRPRPRRRRRRAQRVRGVPHRRRLRQRQVGAARSRPFHRGLRSERASDLLGMAEIAGDWKRLTDRSLPAGSAARLAGLRAASARRRQLRAATRSPSTSPATAGPPPMVHLRRGETLRRYLEPGLADGKTFVFWGRNYNTGGIPGPERSHTWVNQPDKMYRLEKRRRLQARPGPLRQRGLHLHARLRQWRLQGGRRRGGRPAGHLRVPHAVHHRAPRRANAKAWGIYEPGCRNGLVLRGKADCDVSRLGRSGQDLAGLRQDFADGLDLTDRVKGHRQYWLRLSTGAKALAGSGLTITTVCQANPAVMPRLKDGGSTVTFAASGRAVVSAGPTLPQAKAHVVAGKFGTPRVTLELGNAARRAGHDGVRRRARAFEQSAAIPRSSIRSMFRPTAARPGGRWCKDWTITRRGDEPEDFWSQSLCWGSAGLAEVMRRDQGARAFPQRRREGHRPGRNAPGLQGIEAGRDGSGIRVVGQRGRSRGQASLPALPLGPSRRARM